MFPVHHHQDHVQANHYCQQTQVGWLLRCIQEEEKARSSASSKDPHAVARELVASINASSETFDLPEDDDDDVRRTLVSLAAYAMSLEPAEKSSSQIATEVDRLTRTAVSGIKKQMTVRLNASRLNASSHSGYASYCILSYFDALY